jgi:hypothetical protein
MPFYVTMTDKHMSGWGMAAGRVNKLVFECGTYEEACIVAQNARNHGSQIYVNINGNKPYYSPNRYYVQYKDRNEYPSWYQPGYFRKQ